MLNIIKGYDDNILELLSQIKKAKNILIVSHFSPDSDAIGSSLGFYHFLSSVHKNVTIYNESKINNYLQFFPSSNIISNDISNQDFDLVIITDCGTSQRTGSSVLSLFKNSYIVNIDHHISNNEFGDLVFLDTNTSSASEIVFDILTKIEKLDSNYKITNDSATCLYAGISSDTGSFKFAIKENTFLIANELTKYDINISKIAQNLFSSESKIEYQNRAYAMNKMKFYHNDKLCFVEINNSDYKAMGIENDSNLQTVKSEILKVKSTEIGVFARETKSEFKISLRGKRADIDLNKFAGFYNGGGHSQASGIKLSKDLYAKEIQNIINKLISLL